TAESRAASLRGNGVLIGNERCAKAVYELCDRFGRRPWERFRRHLTRGDTVMNFHPDREVIRVSRVVAQLREVESGSRRGGAVAAGAIFLDKSVAARKR